MNSNTTLNTINGIEVLYKATMELYQTFFETLEATLANTKDDDSKRLIELHTLAKEAKEALDYDLAIFDKAIYLDVESMRNVEDELKIQTLHNKLGL